MRYCGSVNTRYTHTCTHAHTQTRTEAHTRTRIAPLLPYPQRSVRQVTNQLASVREELELARKTVIEAQRGQQKAENQGSEESRDVIAKLSTLVLQGKGAIEQLQAEVSDTKFELQKGEALRKDIAAENASLRSMIQEQENRLSNTEGVSQECMALRNVHQHDQSVINGLEKELKAMRQILLDERSRHGVQMQSAVAAAQVTSG